MRTVKGFITRDGEKVNLPSGGNVVEEYTDNEARFRDSDIIGTILSAGIHQVLYKQEGTDVATNHFLFVKHATVTHPRTHIKCYVVEQCTIDESGMFIRSRMFKDENHTDPYSDWREWESAIPIVTDNIREGSLEAITSGAVYAALAGKADAATLASKMNNAPYTGLYLNNDQGTFPIRGEQYIEEALTAFVENFPSMTAIPCVLTVFIRGTAHKAGAFAGWYWNEDDFILTVEIHTLAGYRLIAEMQTEQEGPVISTFPTSFDTTDTRDLFS